jgi:hypothetical protein
MTNPQFQMGISTLSGRGPMAGLELAKANRLEQAAALQNQRGEAARAALGAGLTKSGGQLTLEAIAPLAEADPILYTELYNKIAKEQRLQQAEEMKAKILGAAFGGGGVGEIDPTTVAAAGAMSNDPQLMGLATFLQGQQNRTTDEANRIAAEERATAKERKKADIPGFEVDPEVTIDQTSARSARELVSAIPTYEGAIKKIKKLIDKHGSTTGYGQDTDAVSQAFLDLLNAERGLNNTGVLNVGEIPTLEQVYKTFDPRNPWNLTKSKDELKESAEQYLADRKGLIEGKLRSIGYTRKGKADAGVDIKDARQAPDGNYYIPDPARPGKYLKVEQ